MEDTLPAPIAQTVVEQYLLCAKESIDRAISVAKHSGLLDEREIERRMLGILHVRIISAINIHRGSK